MASDKEVLREIWDGKIPVCFNLNQQEIYGLQTPECYYLMVPRVSYFPLVWDKVRKHFIRHIHPERQEMEMWLDFNGVPIKWHYPIGVLFDLYSYDIQLPWTLTVNFEKFPEDKLLHCSSREAVESHFLSTLKEADALKHRSQIISIMQKKEHMQLWLGLQNGKFDQFWTINKKFMEGPCANEKDFKYIPFRCYIGDEVPFVQKLMKSRADDGNSKTLCDLVREIYQCGCDSMRVITHGIEPPWDVPLQWLSEHLSYPDNFLHLCMFKK